MAPPVVFTEKLDSKCEGEKVNISKTTINIIVFIVTSKLSAWKLNVSPSYSGHGVQFFVAFEGVSFFLCMVQNLKWSRARFKSRPVMGRLARG